MTIKELEDIATILRWAKGKVLSSAMFDRIHACSEVIERELKIKREQEIRVDVSGNEMNDGD